MKTYNKRIGSKHQSAGPKQNIKMSPKTKLYLFLISFFTILQLCNCINLTDGEEDENEFFIPNDNNAALLKTDFPVITFIHPVENQVIDAGTPINAILTASDDSYPVVTVNLYCNLAFVTSVTQSISSVISILPPNGTYGGCVVNMSNTVNYVTTDTVTFKYYRRLYFVYPENNQQIYTFSDFNALVNAVDGSSDDLVRITFDCASPDDFRARFPVGVLEVVNMDSGFQGPCTVTTTALALQYSEAVPISVTIITPLILITPIPSIVTSGQTIQIQIGSVDGANILINVITTCYSQRYIQEIRADILEDYTFPSYLTGASCTMFAESTEPYYGTISASLTVAML